MAAIVVSLGNAFIFLQNVVFGFQSFEKISFALF